MRRVAALLLACVSGPALAQGAGSIAPPPVRQTIDDNGVDVLRGTFLTGDSDVSIGSGSSALSYRSFAYNGQWSDDETATIDKVGTNVTVTVNGASDGFIETAGTFYSSEGNGATLVPSGGILIYTSRNGTVVKFAANGGQLFGFNRASLGRIIELTRPNGYSESYNYHEEDYCGSGWEGGECPAGVKQAWRLTTVTNNAGYRLTFAYAYSGSNLTVQTFRNWARITSVAASNLVDPVTATATFNTTTDTSGNTTRTATDPLGRTTTYYKGAALGPMTTQRPGASTPNVTVTYSASTGEVSNVMREGVAYAYSYADSGSTRTTTVTAPNATTRVYVGDTTTFLLSSYRNELNATTNYIYDTSGRVTEITAPEGNKTLYAYDARGNVTTTTAKAKPGSGATDIVTQADYAATCTNPLTCNQPTATRDAKGNQTDYTYDTTTGQVTTVTAPAPTTGAVRPQVRYSYATTGGVSLLTGVLACQTTVSCAGGLDEVKTTIAYNAALQPVSTSSGAGNGSLTATTAVSYDAYGNRTYTDGPLPGTADTTRILYDLARQPVGVIGPDPDGPGAMKNRATRLTYNPDGKVTLTEAGTTTGQSDSDWAAFISLQSASSTYDANARKTTDSVVASGTTYALTQYSYDALGRPECSATRMNAAAFGSLPPSACTLGTEGSFGPDRIGKTTYDAAGQVIKVERALGTGDAGDYARLTYTPNGKVSWMRDGENNPTAYQYDGHDRLLAQYYPKADGSGVNWTDFDAFFYDPNGNLVSRRLRDAQVIGYSYDALDRLVFKHVPAGAYAEVDVTYGYDLLGRPTSTSGANGHFVNRSFDALGRMTGESSYFGTKGLQHDLAGRMTRTSWPDGLFVDYDRLYTGEVWRVRENGATSGPGVLAGYGHDDLGRRTSISRGNGVTTGYGYDAVSQLVMLAHDASGTANDVTTTMTYNPAGQIATRSTDNDAYAYTAITNKDVTETPNGLNQLTSQSPSPGVGSLGYDARGNVSGIGATSYLYTSENRLGIAGSTYIAYGPTGNILQRATGSSYTRFDHVGSALVTELDETNTVQRRYVHGTGTDEVLTWYEGSGTSDRRWLLADERGSTVGVTDGSGAVTNKLSYDDYGTPASTNVGRFQYTGQAWLPELGMSYYKARIYNPAIGRFMQTDPIGYDGGVNLYAYVGGDPVNLVDPSGMMGEDDFDEPMPRNVSGACSGPFRPSWCDALLGEDESNEIVVTGSRKSDNTGGGSLLSLPNSDDLRALIEQAQRDFNQWFWTRTRHDISGTSVCWKACGPGLSPVQTYSPAEQAGTMAAFGGVVVGGVAAPVAASAAPSALAASRTFGVASSRFGNPAFGANGIGSWNTGMIRSGWGRGLGNANFRIAYQNSKFDVVKVPIPRGGFR